MGLVLTTMTTSRTRQKGLRSRKHSPPATSERTLPRQGNHTRTMYRTYERATRAENHNERGETGVAVVGLMIRTPNRRTLPRPRKRRKQHHSKSSSRRRGICGTGLGVTNVCRTHNSLVHLPARTRIKRASLTTLPLILSVARPKCHRSNVVPPRYRSHIWEEEIN